LCRSPSKQLDNIVPGTVAWEQPRSFARSSSVTLFSGPEKGIAMLSRFSQVLIEFLRREDGPTAVEYAVMLALIIVVCVAAITSLGTNANATFTSVSNAIGSTAS
jgi:pilus assembly protein Flp/PilA